MSSSGQGEENHNDQHPFLSNDQHPFLSSPQQYPHYGNIIVNVNNGVQYMPGLEYSVFMDAPPPYSEVGSGENPNASSENNPPPYSTLDCSETDGVRSSSSSDATTADPPQRMTPTVVQSCLGGQQAASDRCVLVRERSGAG